MKQMIIRTLNLIFVICILFTYQQYALDRAQMVSVHEKEERQAKVLTLINQSIIQKDELETGQGEYKDGIYEGIGIGYGGDIKIRLTVERGAIYGLEIVSAEGEDDLYLNLAKELLDRIVEQQSVDDIDRISGATYSSQGILDATQNALEGAKNE